MGIASAPPILATGYGLLRCARNDGSASPQLHRGLYALPRCRRPSSTAKFCEHGFDLAINGESAFRRCAQAAIDTRKLFRRRFVFAILESRVEFKPVGWVEFFAKPIDP
jgi:hypothetical protein